MAEHDFMVPNKPSITFIREDSVIDLHDSPRIENLDAEMDPLGDGGSQGHPAKLKQKRHMDYFG